MALSNETYAVVVVGGGPAGAAAARAAAERNLRTLLVARGPAVPPTRCPGWLGPKALAALGPGGAAVAEFAAPFHGVQLHSWDFKSTALVDDPDLRGAVLRAASLAEPLLAAARTGGAEVRRGTSVAQLTLGDAHATLQLSDGATVRAGVVLIADGAATPTAEFARVPAARHVAHLGSAALAVCAAVQPKPGVELVLGAARGLRLATVVRGPHDLRVTLLTRDDAGSATEQLRGLLAAGAAAKVWPPVTEFALGAVPCLAGAALEMESHVGKRCLLIGDAGGFVGAFSNEGLYGALRSGVLAVESASRALAAPVFQDELAGFSGLWRADLADYLRWPNTDLSLLLPMVFNNAQMARRVARAFLLGELF